MKKLVSLFSFAILAFPLFWSCSEKEPEIPVASVTLSQPTAEMVIGESITLNAIISPSNATVIEVIWASSKQSVATVDQGGKVVAIAEGTSAITATAGGKVDSCVVNVSKGVVDVSSIYLDKTSASLKVGEKVILTTTVKPDDATDKTVTWSTSDASVATISDGVVTAIRLGSATITAKAGDKEATCVIIVEATSVSSITLDKTSITLKVGETVSLTATVKPDDATDKTVTWNSSDASIAEVNNGEVTAMSKGTATIKAETNDGSGVFASCEIIVKNPCPAGSVDLGLSVYWACCNLCKSGFVGSPEDYGDYYAWGETETKSDYSWSTYKFGTSYSGPFSKYNTNSSYGTVDNNTVLDPEDDVAHVKLGGSWRMPTHAEWEELIDNCSLTWVANYNGTGINGRLVTATNGNSIFLPAAGTRLDTHLYDVGSDGNYWSSSLAADSPNYAWLVLFSSGYVYRQHNIRYDGLSVRPVTE